VPGTFFFVGGGNEEIGATYPHHHPKFDVDERAMLIIGKLFVSAVFDYLSSGTVHA
jgi:metal-dependent amidase/aminoacylase/carboxypeptidase family protein